ncbi:hypothetical protein niasHT_030819 [Heterodera trifolii]|uniref:Uncharacterized protein n=1 Tax=Heterodera trifolii TaxID=157864 RepID=A0ABD2HXI3_9BILA
MDDKKGASLLSFLNLLSSDLGLEDFQSLREAKPMLPALIEFVKTGQLRFMDTHGFSIHTAFSEIEAATGEKLCASLLLGTSDDSSKNGDIELAKVFLALIFSLRILHVDQFNALISRLGSGQAHTLGEMVNLLYLHRRSAELPLTQVLSLAENGVPPKKLSASANAFPFLHNNSDTLHIFSSPTKYGVIDGGSPSASPGKQSADEEEMAKQKIRSTELKGRMKQLEKANEQLNDQLNMAQEEYNNLDIKFEEMRVGNLKLQDTVHNLNGRLKEAQDESELRRYEFEQLKREQKNANERNAKAMDKQAKEVKDKDQEVQMLHNRLNDYAKKFAAKEALESRVKFLEQQIVNQQGMQRELREEMERALNRANTAETELSSLKKQMMNATTTAQTAATASGSSTSDGKITNNNTQKYENAPFGSSSNVVSLQDELNSTLTMANNNSNKDGNCFVNNGVTDDELARIKTQLEVLECENRQLRQSVDNSKAELDSVRNNCEQRVKDKAVDIERLQQDCEASREEIQKLRQKEALSNERQSSMEAKNSQLEGKLSVLELSLDKAATVIEQYSTASEKHCSAAELLQVQHELTKTQAENQQLRNKMEQFKHQATQEQRLISEHWYSTHRELLRSVGGGMRSFLRRQLDAAMSSSAAGISPPSSSSVTQKLPHSHFTTYQPTRWWGFNLLVVFICSAFLICCFTDFAFEFNYNYDAVFSHCQLMDDKKGASLLSFLNLLSSDLGLEDFQSLREAKPMLPALIEFVKTGQLRFMDTHGFSIHTAFSEIEAATGEKLCASLLLGTSDDSSKNGDIELAKVFLALIFSLRILHVDQFNALIARLEKVQARILGEMIGTLCMHRLTAELPFSQVLSPSGKLMSANAFPLLHNNNSNKLQIFSSPTKSGILAADSPSASPGKQSADEEEMAKQKIRSTELKGRMKQLEKANEQLNDQLNMAQEEYNNLDIKFEEMRVGNLKLQDTVHNLNGRLKEAQDESELRRYEFEQLKREQKNANERNAKASGKMGKHEKELEEKERELQLLHKRLDDYAKKFAAKEALESRVKFLEQQIVNYQGMQRELHEETEQQRQKEALSEERRISLEANNSQLEGNLRDFELSLDKAATVIEQYSTASEKHCSAAELLQVQHELTKTQAENQQLRNKMEQFKHQATQEQRLISEHWYSTHRELLRSVGGGMRSFLRRQLDAAMSSSAAGISPPSSSSVTQKLPHSHFTTYQPTRWWGFNLLVVFICSAFLICCFTDFAFEFNFNYDV